jgi:hypothetical protein
MEIFMTLTPEETARLKQLQAKPEAQRTQAEKDELAALIEKRDS